MAPPSESDTAFSVKPFSALCVLFTCRRHLIVSRSDSPEGGRERSDGRPRAARRIGQRRHGAPSNDSHVRRHESHTGRPITLRRLVPARVPTTNVERSRSSAPVRTDNFTSALSCRLCKLATCLGLRRIKERGALPSIRRQGWLGSGYDIGLATRWLRV